MSGEKYNTLELVNSISDLKKLNIDQLISLSNEIREVLINRISITGGHFGSNLGIIELTIALHYVFSSPIDKIVFDVSHQTYTHKILTGRKDLFLNESKFNLSSGFTNYLENINDCFTVGHTSSSIALALGLAKSRDLSNKHYNVISLIGDGSLSGGIAFEALSNAALLSSNFIIIINDNEMSIAENHGSIYSILEKLRVDKKYRESPSNVFVQLGYKYDYLENGNDIEDLIGFFAKYKDISEPIVLHIHTKKGYGYELSYKDEENYHYRAPFNKENGENLYDAPRTFEVINGEYFKKKLEQNANICLICAGTPKNFNFSKELRNTYKNRFIDVGISEDLALLYGVGLSKGNTKPVVSLSSSFIQRAYDQIAHEVGLNKPNMIVLVDFAGVSKTSATHQGLFDVAMISAIPNITYLSPSSEEEYISMLDYCLNHEGTFFIRLYGGLLLHNSITVNENNLTKFEYIIKENNIAIIGISKLSNFALELHDKLKKEGINSSVFVTHNLSYIDKDFLNELINNHKMIVTIEDTYLEGGFGEKISSYLGTRDVKVLNYGIKKTYIDNIDLNNIYHSNRIDINLIIEDILKLN